MLGHYSPPDYFIPARRPGQQMDTHFGSQSRTVHHSREPLFVDPPNSLFPQSRAATAYVEHEQAFSRASSRQTTPSSARVSPAPGYTPSPSPFPVNFMPVNYRTPHPVAETSSWYVAEVPPNATVVPDATDIWVRNVGSNVFDDVSYGPTKNTYSAGLPKPSPPPPMLTYGNPASDTVYQGMIPHPGPLQPLDPHRQSPAAVSRSERTENKRISSSRAAPYPSHQTRQSIANQGSADGPTYRKHSTCENSAQKRKPNARLSSRTHNTDWSKLAPGRSHVIVSNAAKVQFVSYATLRDFEELGIKAELVTYAPRSPEYLAIDHALKIDFSENGIPGPRLVPLSNKEVKLDGADDEVFASTGWRATKFCLDWPGLPPRSEGIDVEHFDKSKVTRGELGVIVSHSIIKLIKAVRTGRRPYSPPHDIPKWDLNDVHVKSLRLISLNYYKANRVWIPVLAVDGSV